MPTKGDFAHLLLPPTPPRGSLSKAPFSSLHPVFRDSTRVAAPGQRWCCILPPRCACRPPGRGGLGLWAELLWGGALTPRLGLAGTWLPGGRPPPGPPLCHPLFHWVVTPRTNQETRAKPLRNRPIWSQGSAFGVPASHSQPLQPPARQTCRAFVLGQGLDLEVSKTSRVCLQGASHPAGKTRLDSSWDEE